MKIFLDGDTENGQVLMDGVKEEEGSSVTYQFSRVQELGFWASLVFFDDLLVNEGTKEMNEWCSI